MGTRLRRSASVATLVFASATPLFADGGQWTSRYWGLGWGDGYHAPPRTGVLHLHSAQRQAPAFRGQPSGLMPGGYPARGPSDDSQFGSQLPKWLWDPTDESVVVDTVEPSSSASHDPVPAPPPSPVPTKPSHDPSLGLPPSLAPAEPIDPRAMRRGRTQARSNGW